MYNSNYQHHNSSFGTNGYDSDENVGFYRPPRSPLTKQVNEVHYEIPKSKYTTPWHYAPEFIKVFSDAAVHEGETLTFDCVLLGSPRPRVIWLFNDRKLHFSDVQITDTADVCQLKIQRVRPEHYGHYRVVAENELGTAATAAILYRP